MTLQYKKFYNEIFILRNLTLRELILSFFFRMPQRSELVCFVLFSGGNYYYQAFSRDSGLVLTCRDPGIGGARTRLRTITSGESLRLIVAGFMSGYAE